MQTYTLYSQDFYTWTQQQAELLRSGRLQEIDVEHLLEEIESLGRQERQELRNRLGILLGHLLKGHYQPEGRSKSWFYTLKEQRQDIQRHLKENPSLKPYLSEAIEIGYEKGLNWVGQETPLDPRKLPSSCFFSDAEILEGSEELEP